MSADNYLYVGKRGDKYVIVDRCASSQYRHSISHRERAIATLDDAWSAWQEACRLDYIGAHYTEYGVNCSPGVAKELGWAA